MTHTHVITDAGRGILLDDRVNRSDDDARDVTLIIEVTVRVLDYDGADRAMTRMYDVRALEPRQHLAEQVEGTAGELGFRVGEALDAFAQAEAWGR